MRRTPLPLSVLVFALAVLAAPALAAYVCHPDPAGTQSLRLRGHVVGYTLRGTDVLVAVRDAGRCRTVAWAAATGRTTPSASACSAVAATPLAPPPRTVRIQRPPAGVDLPDRIVVSNAQGRTVESWPLPVRVRRHTLQVSGPLAAYSALGGHGLWVTRLTDGRTTFVAPVRPADRPRLDAVGVTYQDNVYKHAPADRPLLKFVPTAALGQELAQVAVPVHTSGPIRSISMDGTRVALAAGATSSGCDRVLFWNIPWRSVEQVSENAGPMCAASGASRRISQVTLGGERAQWITSQHGRPALVAIDDVGCQEWVIERLSDRPAKMSLGAIAATGTTLAFALVDRTSNARSSAIGLVSPFYRPMPLYDIAGTAAALSTDGLRTAVLTTSGRVDVRAVGGSRVGSFTAPHATALALHANRIVTTTSTDRVNVYTPSGSLVHSWRLPARIAPRVSVEYGIGVVTAGRTVYAVQLATGRIARLAVAPAAARAQIGSVGVVYAYSLGGRGTAALVPMSEVEAALR